MTSVEGGGSSRRGMVAALLNPPSVALELLEKKKKDEFGKRSKVTLTSFTPCSLCHDGHPEEDVLGSQGVEEEDDLLLVTTEALRTLMVQVGVVLDQDLNFCSFCLAQVQNLLRFKREMDRMGERFVTMVTGLQDILLLPTTPQANILEEEEEEEDVVHIKSSSLQSHSNVDLEDSRKKKKRCLNQDMDMTKRFPCTDCPEVFRTQSDLCLHSITHKKKKRGRGRPKKLASRIDPVGPTKKKNLHSLTTTTTTAGKSLSCPKCLRVFSQRHNLERHLPSHLPQAERAFPCPLCPWRCANKYDLKSHINQVHHHRGKKKAAAISSGRLDFFKTQKKKAEVDNKKKNGAVVGKATEKPYTCNLCPLRFDRKGKLLRHGQTHLPKDQRTLPLFACEICSRKFWRKDERSRHMVIIHQLPSGEMPSVEALASESSMGMGWSG